MKRIIKIMLFAIICLVLFSGQVLQAYSTKRTPNGFTLEVDREPNLRRSYHTVSKAGTTPGGIARARIYNGYTNLPRWENVSGYAPPAGGRWSATKSVGFPEIIILAEVSWDGTTLQGG